MNKLTTSKANSKLTTDDSKGTRCCSNFTDIASAATRDVMRFQSNESLCDTTMEGTDINVIAKELRSKSVEPTQLGLD